VFGFCIVKVNELTVSLKTFIVSNLLTFSCLKKHFKMLNYFNLVLDMFGKFILVQLIYKNNPSSDILVSRYRYSCGNLILSIRGLFKSHSLEQK